MGVFIAPSRAQLLERALRPTDPALVREATAAVRSLPSYERALRGFNDTIRKIQADPARVQSIPSGPAMLRRAEAAATEYGRTVRKLQGVYVRSFRRLAENDFRMAKINGAEGFMLNEIRDVLSGIDKRTEDAGTPGLGLIVTIAIIVASAATIGFAFKVLGDYAAEAKRVNAQERADREAVQSALTPLIRAFNAAEAPAERQALAREITAITTTAPRIAPRPASSIVPVGGSLTSSLGFVGIAAAIAIGAFLIGRL
ncbi:MAG: hypothetical protein AAGJ54_05805 [Planctomycetota bacterium]